MPTLRAGIVGTGFISVKKHIPALLKHKGRVEIAAIADLNELVARKVAARFGIPRAYREVSEMLDREHMDLVHVCTPPRHHAAVALQALSRGCHVLIEKPMAVTVAECDDIIQVAQAHRVLVSVAHSDLFYPPFIRAQQLVTRGAIGDFTGMRILLSTPTDYMTSQEDHWAHKLPGGVIGESGPHVVYLTLAFINPITQVRVHASKHLPYPWSRFDDYRIELIGDRAVSSITSTYASDQWAAQVDLWGTRGMLKLDLELMSVVKHIRRELSAKELAASGVRESFALSRDVMRTGFEVLTRRYWNTHDVLVGRFIDSILLGTPLPVSPEEGREAVRVMDLIVQQLDSEG